MARRFRYESVPGLFVQSEPSSSPDPHPPAFGLKAHASATYWADFQARIKRLQGSALPSTRYVVCWLARHGQGWRKLLGYRDSPELLLKFMAFWTDNVAVDKYGPEEWEETYSKQNGDKDITWGPDAKLTPLGEAQAKGVNEVWKTELARPDDPVPIPTKLFSSPMSRALATTDITFRDVIPKADDTGDLVSRPLVLEACPPNLPLYPAYNTHRRGISYQNLREQLEPYTSEHRSSRTQIQSVYPAFEIEEGFTEEDGLWGEDFSERDTPFNNRIRATLDRIFGDILESTDTYVSITSHGGVAATILRFIGHRSYPLPAGGVIPVVIKATAQH
ncbi:hypothetical protein FRC09_019187 [Ceratobasidium sp. 395]|nr:hypothetical protein FRC09_019187 [Ceratobasidium sp. 395]